MDRLPWPCTSYAVIHTWVLYIGSFHRRKIGMAMWVLSCSFRDKLLESLE